jgi:hypothetical protein
MLKPRRTFRSVIRELAEGLEGRTITIEENTEKAQSEPFFSREVEAERNGTTAAPMEMPSEHGKDAV